MSASLESSAVTLFEPTLSVSNGTFNAEISGAANLPNGTLVEASYTTVSGGVRYGVRREYITVAAAVDYNFILASTDANIDIESTGEVNLGLALGYEWNIPLRTNIVLGVPMSSLELGYFFSDKTIFGLKVSSMSVDLAGVEVRVEQIGATVSFPIEFEYPRRWWRRGAFTP